MKEIVIASGKGGTGKTSLAGAFAAMAGRKVLVDCDTDAPDLHLLLQPFPYIKETFLGGKKASIRQDRCTGCGLCRELCRFQAVHPSPQENTFLIDQLDCEGCGLCFRACPANAILFEPTPAGQWFVSATRLGPLIHARLGIAQANSGKLVSLLRREARALAERAGYPLIMVDGPPGIGCPVIASLTGADLVVAVAEPTSSGLHDLRRLVELTDHFRIPTVICINKWDIHAETAEKISEEMARRGVNTAGKISYDPTVTRAQIKGLSIVEYGEGLVTSEIRTAWENISLALSSSGDIDPPKKEGKRIGQSP